MKIKSVLALSALSLLAAAGAANAATIATAPLTAVSDLTGITHGEGSGTAVLDDSGTLTLNWTSTTTVLGTNVMSIDWSDVLTGTISGSVFTPTGGHTHSTGCTLVSGTNFCSNLTADNTFTSVTGSLDLADGASASFVTVYNSAGGPVTTTYNVGPLTMSSPAPVPLPAAAWLLGSGLVGLFGTARRRTAAAA